MLILYFELRSLHLRLNHRNDPGTSQDDYLVNGGVFTARYGLHVSLSSKYLLRESNNFEICGRPRKCLKSGIIKNEDCLHCLCVCHSPQQSQFVWVSQYTALTVCVCVSQSTALTVCVCVTVHSTNSLCVCHSPHHSQFVCVSQSTALTVCVCVPQSTALIVCVCVTVHSTQSLCVCHSLQHSQFVCVSQSTALTFCVCVTVHSTHSLCVCHSPQR